jgi:hypothetical protein
MRALALAVAAAASVACGVPLARLPAGSGVHATDATAALDQATAACRGIRSLTAEIGVSGSANGHRVRARIMAGIAAPASARLEAVAPFGPPLFILVATGTDATLLLPRDDRVLRRGRPGEVLDAVAGVPLDASDLREMMTGCAAGGATESAQARAFGADWRVVPTSHDGELYLRREQARAPWRLIAVTARTEDGRRWRADYLDFQDNLPRTIRLTSGGESAFDLRLALSQVETNVALDADVFRVRIPASAVPITLEELRRAGPLGGAESPQRSRR